MVLLVLIDAPAKSRKMNYPGINHAS